MRWSLLLLLAVVSTRSDRVVMPWFCLERCGDNSTAIDAEIAEIVAHTDLFAHASFELYNLGPGGQLQVNNLTQVGDILNLALIETYPMISSYPYPPEFMTWMRELFNGSAAGDDFIRQCIDAVLANNWSGLNVDWEPQSGVQPTHQDALDYARFLNRLGAALHSVEARLTVDVGHWNALFDYTVLGQIANVDRIIVMGTYTANFTTFQKQLHLAVQQIGVDKLGVGLSTMNLNTKQPFSETEIRERFELVKSYEIQEIDLWLMPVPDNWLPYVRDFIHPRNSHE